MQVYAEYALAENFCMDFVLLFCAKAVTKNTCGYFRIGACACLGACFAVVYPLMRLPAAWGVIVKITSGLALCAAAGRYSRFSGYVKFTAVFGGATFLLGGALMALFAMTGLSYEGGSGYIISSVPIGIPLFFALILAISAVKISKHISARRLGGNLTCTVKIGEKQVTLGGFYDSGNKVYCGGVPVSIIPFDAAEKIIDREGIKTFVDIHTVAGKDKIPVFRADSLILGEGDKRREIRGVSFGISPSRIKKIILHSDISEVN